MPQRPNPVVPPGTRQTSDVFKTSEVCLGVSILKQPRGTSPISIVTTYPSSPCESNNYEGTSLGRSPAILIAIQKALVPLHFFLFVLFNNVPRRGNVKLPSAALERRLSRACQGGINLSLPEAAAMRAGGFQQHCAMPQSRDCGDHPTKIRYTSRVRYLNREEHRRAHRLPTL
jgi:hypothetical protein